MSQPLRFALNHITSPQLRFAQFLDLTQELGVRSVEIRNDLPGVEIQDGTPAAEIRRQAEARGVEILSINALYPFDVWNAERAAKAEELAAYAAACGARGLVLCPLNSTEDKRSAEQRARGLREALTGLMPILQKHGLTGLVEPLGFPESALRLKRVAVAAIDEVGGASVFELVHDTFHHYLADEREFFPERTGLVHISGVEDSTLPKAAIKDAHRVLIGPADLMDNVGQIRTLLQQGYQGPFSFEPFSEQVHRLSDQAGALRSSMAFVAQGLER
ncbi:TIM barrel protein [Benzoatithermus flavus]|uniref:TIM barrel protein n=1 Tax=Benzoatithermus flavus TaxID=3108223 RepID=A0ABU8XQP7_9PROT